MNTALANPKTTLLGVLTIVGGLVNAALDYMQGRPVNTTILLTTISTGIALIMAKDGSTHSTQSEVNKSSTEAAVTASKPGS
jgi:hypothetical protein